MFSAYLKRDLRNKTSLFWHLAFPVALMICFTVAFGNIYDMENRIDPVPCAIVVNGEANSFTDSFLELVKNVDTGEDGVADGSNKYLSVIDTRDCEQALEMLKNEEIRAIYQVNSDGIDVLLSESCGMSDSMIVRALADTFLNNYGIIMKSVESGNLAKMAEVMAILNSEISNVAEKKGAFDTDPDPFQWYYYATLVMAIMFNIQEGITVISEIQANLSKTAMRTAVSPEKKSKIVLSIFGASYLVANGISLFSLVIMKYIFGIEMGSRIGLLVLFIFMGNLFAISTGMMFGSVLKGTVEQRINKSMGWIMASVFLGGEMMANLPGYFEKSVPIINDINPATVLNMALYKVTNYNELGGFYLELLKISVVAVVMIAFTVMKVRREKYASL